MSRAKPDPIRRQQLHGEAVLHFATALEQTRLELSRLGRDNAHALYVSSMLVCFCTFAKGPGGGDFFMFTARGDDEPATWLKLVRGVRIVIITRPWEAPSCSMRRANSTVPTSGGAPLTGSDQQLIEVCRQSLSARPARRCGARPRMSRCRGTKRAII